MKRPSLAGVDSYLGVFNALFIQVSIVLSEEGVWEASAHTLSQLVLRIMKDCKLETNARATATPHHNPISLQPRVKPQITDMGIAIP